MSARRNTPLPIHKYHGLGNDFIVLDARRRGIFLSAAEAAALCDRHTGVGGDGVIWVLKGTRAPLHMHIHNADGSEPGMCGNGVRVFAHFLADQGLLKPGAAMPVQTPSGMVTVTLLEHHDADATVKVDMGRPRLSPRQIPVLSDKQPVLDLKVKVGGKDYLFNCVSMGNPHAIHFTTKITDALVLGVGPLVERHKLFPQKTNVEFAVVRDRGHITMRVFERGVGETQACGTGACATAVAAMLRGVVDQSVTVSLLGGDLCIEWPGKTKPVFMTGPSKRVFTGQLG